MDSALSNAPAEGFKRGCLYGDAAYASRHNVKACRERGPAPIIKLKASTTTRGKGAGDTWSMAIRDQLGGPTHSHTGGLSYDKKRRSQDGWKKRAGYGRRWIVEIVFSACKRIFGEHLYSLKWKNMYKRSRSRWLQYNKLVEMGAKIA